MCWLKLAHANSEKNAQFKTWIFTTLGDFKVGVSVGVYCTKCTLNTGVNTNFEITQCIYRKIMTIPMKIQIPPIGKNHII
jgi:hypothetical protein